MPSGIVRVYIGLPPELRGRVYWVERERRKNPLSHQPGGSDVVVEYGDGRVFGYDWVKSTAPYVRTFVEDLHTVVRVFARRYEEDGGDGEGFEQVWRHGDDLDLLTALQGYDDRWKPSIDVDSEDFDIP